MYLCIDLKSFYASVEAVERGLDPFKAPLVVADASRGSGAICLSVTPALKALGVKNRCRLFEIPDNIEYIAAKPRMKKYMEYSADIYSEYLKFISPEDIYVYSVDECFFNIAPYFSMYGDDVFRIADMLRNAVYKRTGIFAAAGIGTNMFLAKVALDVTAKKTKNGIGYLDEDLFKKEIWHHRPITDIWNIGPGVAKRLAKYKIFDLYGVAHFDKDILIREFGVNAKYLIDHANGTEPCTIEDIRSYVPHSTSVSNSQILFEDYNTDDALLVLKEMVDSLSIELTERQSATDSVFLRIGYSKDVVKSTGGSVKLPKRTASGKYLVRFFSDYYKKIVRRGYPIRKISIGFSNLEPCCERNTDIFGDYKFEEREQKKQLAVLNIKTRYGKNSILKAMNLEKRATAMMRNTLVGGHNGE